jgi:hypothetical protein
MAMMIKGIRLDNFDVKRENKDGILEITGNYSLISNADIVLAKQGFNGYSEIKLAQTVETQQLLNKLALSIKSDIETILGLKGGE